MRGLTSSRLGCGADLAGGVTGPEKARLRVIHKISTNGRTSRYKLRSSWNILNKCKPTFPGSHFRGPCRRNLENARRTAVPDLRQAGRPRGDDLPRVRVRRGHAFRGPSGAPADRSGQAQAKVAGWPWGRAAASCFRLLGPSRQRTLASPRLTSPGRLAHSVAGAPQRKECRAPGAAARSRRRGRNWHDRRYWRSPTRRQRMSTRSSTGMNRSDGRSTR